MYSDIELILSLQYPIFYFFSVQMFYCLFVQELKIIYIQKTKNTCPNFIYSVRKLGHILIEFLSASRWRFYMIAKAYKKNIIKLIFCFQSTG